MLDEAVDRSVTASSIAVASVLANKSESEMVLFVAMSYRDSRAYRASDLIGKSSNNTDTRTINVCSTKAKTITKMKS